MFLGNDYFGLEELVGRCLKVEGVEIVPYVQESKPSIFGDTHLVGILNRGVNAIVLDVTETPHYSQAYGFFTSGQALGYAVLKVPKEQLNTVRNIFSSNKEVDVKLPLYVTAIKIGGEKPIPEIIEIHQKVLSDLTNELSPDGRKIIEKLYAAEAGLCGNKESWGILLDEYITGLEETNPRCSKDKIIDMLNLKETDENIIKTVIKDLKSYRENLID